MSETGELSVLLVEDNGDDADLLQRSLKKAGASVHLQWVDSLAAGIALAQRDSFDAILLDLSLPDSYGLASVERALHEIAHVPIVVLTGLDDEAVGSAAVHAGAQDFVVKGHFDGRTITRTLKYAVERHRLVAALEHSNAIKTYFAATMSHELRSTLFAIQGYSEILLEDQEHCDHPRLTRVIFERSREGLALIQAALEVTRAEVEPAEISPVAIDVADLLQQLIAEVPQSSDRPSLRIDLQIPPHMPRLRSDQIKLAMVLRNLVSNALKFTEAGCVQVSVEVTGEQMHFIVADTGIGIEPRELPRLFEPFHQAHGGRSRRAGGSGLGLYIVKRLVDLLGGSVSVESKPGVGTSFDVSLPLAPAMPCSPVSP